MGGGSIFLRSSLLLIRRSQPHSASGHTLPHLSTPLRKLALPLLQGSPLWPFREQAHAPPLPPHQSLSRPQFQVTIIMLFLFFLHAFIPSSIPPLSLSVISPSGVSPATLTWMPNSSPNCALFIN